MTDPQESSPGPRPVRNRARRVLAAVAVSATVALGGLVALAAPAAAAGPTVTVAPSSGLRDGQSVTVTGSGFTPNFAQMVVVQCAASATGANGCNTNDVQFTQTDGNGAFSVQLTVRATFGSTDCTRVSCIVQGHEGFSASSGQTGTSAPLRFAAATGPTSTGSGSPPAGSGSSSPPAQSPSPPATAGGNGANGGSGNGGVGGGAALPTGANSGRAATGGVPPISEIAAAAALVLLLAGAVAYYRRRPRTHRR